MIASLVFTILKYTFIIILWVFVWAAIRSLRKDVAVFAPSQRSFFHYNRSHKNENNTASAYFATSSTGMSSNDDSQNPQKVAPVQNDNYGGEVRPVFVEEVAAETREMLRSPAPRIDSDSYTDSSLDLAQLVQRTENEEGKDTSTDSPIPQLLLITGGTRAGFSIQLEDSPITIGRSSDNMIVLDDEFVSSHHLRLLPDANGEQWVLEDLNSTNGTYVNGVRVRESIILPVLVQVRVGATTFELR